MKFSLTGALCLNLLVCLSQNDGERKSAGIQFEQGLNWTQVIKKAKEEHKNIFVDCYATWCAPCSKMDREVYPDIEVGRLVNNKFISIKLQMDKTEFDDKNIKDWYRQSAVIASDYNVTVLPTFLFFSPNGVPLHKAVGSKNISSFMELIQESLDSTKQYYHLVRYFQPNTVDTAELKGMSRAFYTIDPDLAGRMALDYLQRIPKPEIYNSDNIKLISQFRKDPVIKRWTINILEKIPPAEYKDNNKRELFRVLRSDPQVRLTVRRYLENLSQSQFMEKDNLFLAIDFADTIQVNDRMFTWLYKNTSKVDVLTGIKNQGQNLVNYIILKNLIIPGSVVNDGNLDVDWSKLYSSVKKVTDDKYAERNIVTGKIFFYKARIGNILDPNSKKSSEWGSKYANAVAENIERFGLDTSNPIRSEWQEMILSTPFTDTVMTREFFEKH